jgi:hypothetical protein
MNTIASMAFPVLAFTPNGVMPYSRYENLIRVMKHEYDKDWFDDLEVVDSNGVSAVVRSAKIVKEPVLARLFGRMVEVEIQDSEKLADYDVDAVRDRVLEFLSIYPDMYQSAGVYDDILRRVTNATTTGQIVRAFID